VIANLQLRFLAKVMHSFGYKSKFRGIPIKDEFLLSEDDVNN
jgi:hypothetical protein